MGVVLFVLCILYVMCMPFPDGYLQLLAMFPCGVACRFCVFGWLVHSNVFWCVGLVLVVVCGGHSVTANRFASVLVIFSLTLSSDCVAVLCLIPFFLGGSSAFFVSVVCVVSVLINSGTIIWATVVDAMESWVALLSCSRSCW